MTRLDRLAAGEDPPGNAATACVEQHRAGAHAYHERRCPVANYAWHFVRERLNPCLIQYFRLVFYSFVYSIPFIKRPRKHLTHVRWFTEGFDTAGLQEAEASLDDLSLPRRSGLRIEGWRPERLLRRR
jgi:hypothetical protein